jgi:hypothetical protein
MHAHNLLYYFLALAAVLALYRRVLTPSWACVLALSFYAFDNTRATAIVWIANRNALLCCALSMYAVVLHLRGIEGDRRAGWTSPLWFGAAMLAGEGALGGAAYLFAAECCLARDAWRRRLVRLLPSAAVAIACLISARLLGHGVAYSGEYLDPLRDTSAYLAALPSRCLALLGAELAIFAAEWSNAYDLLLPGLRAFFIVVTAGFVLFWLVLFVPLLRRSASARFFAGGALLALLPAAATFPNGRTLGWVSIGVMGLSAQFFAEYVEGRAGRGWSLQLGAALLILLHLVAAGLGLPSGSLAVRDVGQLLQRIERTAPSDPSIRQRRVVYVNPPQDPHVLFLPAMRALQGIPRPEYQRWLATGMSPIALSRPSANSLELEPEDGFVHEQTERVTRRRPFTLGQRIELPGMRVQVLSLTADGRPKRARFEFERALEDPSYLWLVWRDQGFEPFQPPPLHGSLTIPRVDFATMLLGAEHPVTRALSALRPLTAARSR